MFIAESQIWSERGSLLAPPVANLLCGMATCYRPGKKLFFPPNLLIIYLIFVSPDKKFSTEIEISRKKLSWFLLGSNSLLLFLPEIGSIRYVNARNKVNRICYFPYVTSPCTSVADSHVTIVNNNTIYYFILKIRYSNRFILSTHIYMIQ